MNTAGRLVERGASLGPIDDRGRSRQPARRRSPILAGVAVALALATLGVWWTMPVREDDAPAPARAAAVAMEWEAIPRSSLPLYLLGDGDGDRRDLRLEAERHPELGRRDVVGFGDFDQGGRWQVFAFHRFGPAPPKPASLFVEIARLAADNGLSVERSARPEPMPTKFGVFEVADAMVAAKGAPRHCLVLRSAGEDAHWRMAGIACGGERPLDRTVLVCQIDRLDLAATGEEPGLRALFAEAAKRRQPGCEPPSRAVTAGRRATWLDADGKLPVLKPTKSKP